MATDYSIFIADWTRLREVESPEHLVDLAYDEDVLWIEQAQHGFDLWMMTDHYIDAFVAIYDRLPREYAISVAEFVSPLVDSELKIKGIKKWKSLIDKPYTKKDKFLDMARSPTTLAACLERVADIDFAVLQETIDENPDADPKDCLGDGSFREFFDAHRRVCELAGEKDWGAVWHWFA